MFAGMDWPGRERLLDVMADAGHAWAGVPVPGAGGSLCFTSSDSGYVSAQDGVLYRSADGGANWTMAHPDPFHSGLFKDLPLWSTLACSGSSVWDGLTAIAHEPPPGEQSYIVFASPDNGAHWAAAAHNLGGATGVSFPAAPSPFQRLAGIAVMSPDQALLAGLPQGRWGISVAAIASSGGSQAHVLLSPPLSGKVTPALDPQVPASGWLTMHGITASGDTGWLYLDDGALGSLNKPVARTLLYRTTDDGKSWSLIQQQPSSGG
jgi:hypothetical protein